MSNLLDDATLIQIPSGYKAGTLYSQVPNTPAGDFSVVRGGGANRINSDKKMELMAANVPRLDYSDGDCPVLLTEDAGVNLLTHPLTMSDFTQSGATLDGDPSTAGDENIRDGSFDTDIGDGNWNGTATIGTDGYATLTSIGGNVFISQDNLWDANSMDGKLVKITYEVIESTINGSFSIGGFSSSSFMESRDADKTVGVHTIYVLSGTRNNGTTQNALFMYISGSNTTGYIKIDNVSVKEVQGFAAPSVDYPTGALKLVEDGSNSNHEVNRTFPPDGNKYASSIFIKGGERTKIRMSGGNYNGNYADFDLISGTIINSVGLDFVTIKPLSNGWYRCTVQSGGTLNYGVWVYLLDDNGNLSYQGDGTSGVYIAFPQLEQNSFASSFMFSGVEGSTSLRSADVIGGATYTGDSESGVLMIDIAALSDDKTNRYITLYSDSNNYIRFYFRSGFYNQIASFSKIEGDNSELITSTELNIIDFNKIAIRWNSDGNLELWGNGKILITTQTMPNIPAGTFTKLALATEQNSVNMFAKIKQILILPYLTDEQMAELTTL